MDYITWRNQSLTAAEWFPISVLALEALLGVACNLVAAVTYCKQNQRLFNNPGDTFTISLMIDDLILSGVATPLVIATEKLKATGSPMVMGYLCLSTRCALLFSAVSSASGNALLALDRGDLTLRPSKRFFRQKRAMVAIIAARLLSILTLFLPILTSWHCRENSMPSPALVSQRENRIYFGGKWPDGTNNSLKMVEKRDFCNATCSSNHCSVSEAEFTIRSAIQTIFFTCAAITIIATYTRILHSVKRRDVKRASKNMEYNVGFYSSKKRTEFYLNRWCCCWKEKTEDTLLANNSATNNNGQVKRDLTTSASSPAESRSTPALKRTNNSFRNGEENQKNESAAAGSSDFLQNPRETKAGIHPGRAHFASVALSVQAFIALKRIVREKMEIKRRKHRHLQRMTIAITLTFLLCWMPFHILPYVRISTGNYPKSVTCEIENCIVGSEISTKEKTIYFEESNFPLNVVFLWSFVLVSITSIANPCLYSFSREKIRKEFSRIFCKNKHLDASLQGGNAGKKPFFNNNQRRPVNTEAVLKWKKAAGNKAHVRLQKDSENSPTSNDKLIHNDQTLISDTNLVSKDKSNNFNPV